MVSFGLKTSSIVSRIGIMAVVAMVDFHRASLSKRILISFFSMYIAREIAIACVVRRARAAPVVWKSGTRATNARIDAVAVIILIFSICLVLPIAVRVVVNNETRAMMIVVIDSMDSDVAPFV